MYILKKGRAGIQYNAGKTEALSLETMIRMGLTTERDGEDEQGLHFPDGLAPRSFVSASERRTDDSTAFCLTVLANSMIKMPNISDSVTR